MIKTKDDVLELKNAWCLDEDLWKYEEGWNEKGERNQQGLGKDEPAWYVDEPSHVEKIASWEEEKSCERNFEGV